MEEKKWLKSSGRFLTFISILYIYITGGRRRHLLVFCTFTLQVAEDDMAETLKKIKRYYLHALTDEKDLQKRLDSVGYFSFYLSVQCILY